MLRLATAFFCAVLFVGVYAAIHVGVVADAELRVLEGFMGLPGHEYARDLVGMFDPAPFAVLSLSLVAGALVARRPRAAAAALIIVSPARLRPLAAAAGGLLTVATVFSLLVLGSHYPSDIVGGLLVATTWAIVSSAVLRVEFSPSRSGAALGATILGAAGLLVFASRPEGTMAYAAANTTFVVGALAIAAGALVLSGSVPAPTGAQRRPRSPRARG